MGDFKSRLRTCRESCGLSQEEMAHLCGVAYSTYRRYETGDNEPLLSVSAKIARQLGVSLDYLSGLSDLPPIPAGGAKERAILKKIRTLLEDLDKSDSSL